MKRPFLKTKTENGLGFREISSCAWTLFQAENYVMGQNRGGASGPECYYDTLNVSEHVRAYDLGLRTLGIRNLGNGSRTKPKTTNPDFSKAFSRS